MNKSIHLLAHTALALMAVLVLLQSCDEIQQWSVDQAGGSAIVFGTSDEPGSLALGSPVGCSFGDASGYYRYFKLTVSQRVTVQVEIRNPTRMGVVSWSIYGGTANYSSKDKFVLEPGTYTLYVGSLEPVAFGLALSQIPDLSQGTVTNPVALQVGQNNTLRVGCPSSGAERQSYYSFTLTQDGMYDLVPSGEFTNLSFYLRNTPGVVGDFFDYRYLHSYSGFTDINLRAGTYYLYLYNAANTNMSCDLSINRRGALASEGSLDHPVELQAGVSHEGTVGKQFYTLETTDIDCSFSCYTFTVSESGMYSLGLSGLSNNVYLELGTDSTFESLALINPDLAYTKTGVASLGLQPATYYLKISNTSQTSAQTFSLLATRLGDYLAEGTPDNRVSILPETDHTGKVGGSASGASGSYYTITLPQDGTYAITWSGLASTVIADFAYSDGTGLHDIFYSSNTSGVALRAGAYNLDVYNRDGTNDLSYTMKVERIGEYPLEGSPTAPVPLTVGTAHSGRVGYAQGESSSLYSFTVTEPGSFDIALSGGDSSKHMMLRSADQTAYEFVHAGAGGNAMLSGFDLMPGTWSIEVFADNYSVVDAYSLLVIRSGEYAADGSLAAPLVLEPGIAQAAKVGRSGGWASTSWYKFTVPEGTYSIVASGLGTTVNMVDFYLYSDPDFSTLLASETGSSNTGIAAHNFTAGTYYLKIVSAYNINMDYTLAFDGN